MSRALLSLFFGSILLSVSAAGNYEEFNRNFNDSTLRVDYIFGGGNKSGVHVLLDRQSKSPGWAGRRHHLSELPYTGNGMIEVIDKESRDTLYRNSFSTLFQEWLSEEEADSVAKSFANTFIVPLPKKESEIRLTLFNNRHESVASLSHVYSPTDELVARRGHNILPNIYIHKGGAPEDVIDIAILAEGYRQEEMGSFLEHARMITDEILSYEPYSSHKEKFNFIAVMSPSAESGVSIPLKNEWKQTAFDSHFSTFHSPRYLTTPSLGKVHDALEGIPYEHIVILVNTDQYGGGGIYNSYLMSAARNQYVLPVSVHEFGHSFGGLADEYFYEHEQKEQFPYDIEPWEPNITTKVDFASKWADMMPGADTKSGKGKARKKGNDNDEKVGLYEGGGYRSKGVWRPVETCRMRDNYHPVFCPVCRRALERLIFFYTSEE